MPLALLGMLLCQSKGCRPRCRPSAFDMQQRLNDFTNDLWVQVFFQQSTIHFSDGDQVGGHHWRPDLVYVLSPVLHPLPHFAFSMDFMGRLTLSGCRMEVMPPGDNFNFSFVTSVDILEEGSVSVGIEMHPTLTGCGSFSVSPIIYQMT